MTTQCTAEMYASDDYFHRCTYYDNELYLVNHISVETCNYYLGTYLEVYTLEGK